MDDAPATTLARLHALLAKDFELKAEALRPETRLEDLDIDSLQIGRASCRERVEGSGGAGASRRRHTRSKRDWSSDVCSSDLRRALERQGACAACPLAARSLDGRRPRDHPRAPACAAGEGLRAEGGSAAARDAPRRPRHRLAADRKSVV